MNKQAKRKKERENVVIVMDSAIVNFECGKAQNMLLNY